MHFIITTNLYPKEHTMQRILLTLLCLGMLSTVGCTYNRTLGGPASSSVGAYSVDGPTTDLQERRELQWRDQHGYTDWRGYMQRSNEP
jgi:hypothetical protein